MIIIEPYKSKGEHRWRFRHTNGNIIAVGGEGYKSGFTMRRGLKRMLAAIQAGNYREIRIKHD